MVHAISVRIRICYVGKFTVELLEETLLPFFSSLDFAWRLFFDIFEVKGNSFASASWT